MGELGDFKRPRMLEGYGVSIICAVVGGLLAVGLVYCLHTEARSGAALEAKTGIEKEVEVGEEDGDGGTEDITDLIRYTLCGERTLTDETETAYHAEFTEEGTVSGSFVPGQMDYRVEMDEAGDMVLVLSDKNTELSYALTYDDQYRMVLSDDTHTYTME